MSRGGTIESIADCEELANLINQDQEKGNKIRLARISGILDKNNQIRANIPKSDRSKYSQEKYKFFLEAPFEISNKCCSVMKKEPAHRYSKITGRKAITAQMADESRLRTQQWLSAGCNAFDNKIPISNPMSFWTEQDVLKYIYDNKLPICSVYGEVIVKSDEIKGQMEITDFGIGEYCQKYATTGCNRTGCVLCAFGAHLEKEPRFIRLKQTHPKFYALLDVFKNNGTTYREAIEWYNQQVKENREIKL